MLTNDKRIRIIVGHYGSGKTEFSLNYAVQLSKENYKNKCEGKIALADIDVVNPYFRSREKESMLKKYDIESYSSILKNSTLDLPSISPEILKPAFDKNYQYIIDVGGDHVGAKVLNSFSNKINKNEYDMFIVVNANRELTDTPEKVVEYIQKIEEASGLNVTGIVSNTHMLKETTEDDIKKGIEIVTEVNRLTRIPIRYITYWDKKDQFRKTISHNLKYSDYSKKDLENIIFPIGMLFREAWM